jgi:hypothetical protein
MRSSLLIIGLCALLLGCASIQNEPVNQPGSGARLADEVHLNFGERSAGDDDVIGLSFLGWWNAGRGVLVRRVDRNGANSDAWREYLDA